jgi:hypothetical protein
MKPISEKCRTCTRFLNDQLPKPDCYDFCPKLNSLKEDEVNTTIKTIDDKLKNSFDTALRICPECGKKSLFWNKITLEYECLNLTCKLDSYKHHKNDNVGEKHNRYLDDGGWG